MDAAASKILERLDGIKEKLDALEKKVNDNHNSTTSKLKALKEKVNENHSSTTCQLGMLVESSVRAVAITKYGACYARNFIIDDLGGLSSKDSQLYFASTDPETNTLYSAKENSS